jgi:hypothetical protein
MLSRILQIACFASSIILVGLVGCSRDPGPPPAIAVEQIPAELDKSFKTAKQEIKNLVGKITSALQTKDYPAAYDAVQALGTLPDASQSQRVLTARAALTIYSLLQAAQAQGDENAAAAIRYHQATK